MNASGDRRWGRGALMDISVIGFLRGATVTFLARLAALALLCLLAFESVGKIPGQVEFPTGCDPFGYTRQAQLFRDRGTAGFDTTLETPNSRRLIEIAKATGFPEDEWYQAVAPHCHHYKSRSDRVLLQYPAGVGLMMALFEPEIQRRMLKITAVTGTVALFAALVAFAGNIWSMFLSVASAWVAVKAIEIGSNSDSVGPAMMLSAGSGVLLAYYARNASSLTALVLGILIGFSSAVRITNALLVVFIGVWLVLRLVARRDRRAFLGVVLFGAGAVAGMMPLFWGNFVNTGSPFVTTYSAIDAATPKLSLDLFREGLEYFVSWTPQGRIAIAAFVIWLLVYAFRPRSEALIVSLSGFIASLAYFMSKIVRIVYYAFPPAAVLLGSACATSGMGKAKLRSWDWVNAAGFVAASGSAAFLACGEAPLARPAVPVDSEVRSALSGDPIVWADEFGGPMINHYGVFAAKLIFAPEHVQETLVERVHDANIPQFLLADTASMERLIERLSTEWNLVRVGTAFDYALYSIDSRRTP